MNCILFFFTEISTFEAFKSDFEEFAAWLTQKYPEDAEIPAKLDSFSQKYQNLPLRVRFDKELKKKHSKLSLEEEVTKRLKQAYSADRRVTGDYEINVSSKEACVQS